MTFQERFQELRQIAVSLREKVEGRALTLSSEDIEKFAEAFQRYVSELPDDLKEQEIGWEKREKIGEKIVIKRIMVKRRDIPQLIRKDVEFALAQLRVLSG